MFVKYKSSKNKKKYADKLKEKDIEVLTNKDIGGIIKWVHILR